MVGKMGSPMLMLMVKIATPQLMRWGKRWDGRGQRGQLGLTDASCQRPWREGNPPAGKGDDINFDMIVIFCHQPLTSCYCKTHHTLKVGDRLCSLSVLCTIFYVLIMLKVSSISQRLPSCKCNEPVR